MSDAQTFFQTINWSAPTWDLFIAGVFLIGALMYGFSLGRDRIIVILVSIYMALALMTAPYLDVVMEKTALALNQVFVFKLTGFVGIFLGLFFFLSRSALLRTIAHRDDHGSWWQVMLFSILHMGLLISVIISFLPPEAADHLSPFTRQLFVYDGSRFAWLVAPIVAMMFIQSPKKKKELDE